MAGPGGADGVFARALPQPDRRSCGAASLVVARCLVEDAPPDPAGFRSEVLALHRLLTSPADASGRPQVPWPRALGTPPWAVARHLSLLTGAAYRTRLALLHRAAAYAGVVAEVRPDRPVALYVGNRWLPRHVVLVVAAEESRLWVYEPGRGGVTTVDRAAFVHGTLALAGWDRPWFSVRPRGRRTPA